MKVSVFWFRRDLRIADNVGLFEALKQNTPVLPIFIFDQEILKELPADDARVQFIHERLQLLHETFLKHGSGLLVLSGRPLEVWKTLLENYSIETVFTNRDYEPYALRRDQEVELLLKENGVEFLTFKDQVIFETDEILKEDRTPYTVYTPYKNRWLARMEQEGIPAPKQANLNNLHTFQTEFPSMEAMNFEANAIQVPPFDLSHLDLYHEKRDFPAVHGTSGLSTHLRFGTVSIREMVAFARQTNPVFLSELIWREFFMQILYHFPKVVHRNFREKYDGIQWRNDPEEFKRWCEGTTGYPLVDAGMRELNTTGLMHNRVRMVVASFLCKHLAIDWRWGETYFAQKLLDFDLSANNGNWQWAAGTGCDAAPYFRVFNPSIQLKKFDPDLIYIRKWIPEFDELSYPAPMVDHKMARLRALETYQKGIALHENQ